MNPPQFETNIGTVLIGEDAVRLDGEQYIESKGSGIPKGPLAERMDGFILALFRGGSVLPFGKHGFDFPHKPT